VFSPLSVDTATRTLRRASGAIFQTGGANAQIVLDDFSIVAPTVAGPAAFWGAPLDFGATGGQLADEAGLRSRCGLRRSQRYGAHDRRNARQDDRGTGKPKVADGTIYYRLRFDICPLANSVNLALNNGALQVWAYRLDPGAGFDDTSPALADFASRQINIVCLSDDSDPHHITSLRDHVESASPNDAGGGGTRPRIGVAMLPEGRHRRRRRKRLQ